MGKFAPRLLLANFVGVARIQWSTVPFGQILSLSSYVLSSLATILKLLFLSSLLSSEAYVDYSILFSSTVLFSTALFEWIRATSARLEPIAQTDGNSVLRTQTWTLFAITVTVVFIGLVAIFFAGQLSLRYVVLLGTGIVISAAGDLLLTIFRAQNYNMRFASLQAFRALLAGGLATASAVYSNDPLAAFQAYNVGAFLVVGFFALMQWRALRVLRSLDFGLLRFAFQYGVPTAVSVGLFLLIPNVIRWTIALYPASTDTTAIIMAIDFLQRPYFIAVGSIQAVMFPGLVRAFEGPLVKEFSVKLMRVFRINFAVILLIFIVAWITIPLALDYYPNQIVANKINQQSIFALILFAAQSYIQHSGGVIPSLERRVWKFAILSGIEVVVISISMMVIYWFLNLEDLICIAAFTVLSFAFLTSIWIQKGKVVITKTKIRHFD